MATDKLASNDPLAIDQALRQATARHQAGDLPAAEQGYRAIVEAVPEQPAANHQLGVLLVQLGRAAAGLPYLSAALQANMDYAPYWLSYLDALIRAGERQTARRILDTGREFGLQGAAVEMLAGELAALESAGRPATPRARETDTLRALFREGRYAEAEQLARMLTGRFPGDGLAWKVLGAALIAQGRTGESLAPMEKAVELSPGDADAVTALGNALYDLGMLEEAEANYRLALAIEPDAVEAHGTLGNILYDLGRLEEAEAGYRRALEIDPEYTEAYNNLANTLKSMGRLEEAEAGYRRALQLEPGSAPIFNNLSGVLRELGRLVEAELVCRQALEIEPDLAEAHSNLGNALKSLERPADALACYRRALEIKPDYAEAWYNLGNVFKDLGRLDEAEAGYRRALRVKPGYPEACSNLGVLLLSLGRYAEAWPCYEFRYLRVLKNERTTCIPTLSFPQWQGESLAGKSLAIWTEQGYGDYVQFVRYAPLVKAHGISRLTVVCLPPLKPLLETTAGVDEVIDDLDSVPVHDYWAFPLSIPLQLNTLLETIPAALPYLHAVPARLELWRERLPAASTRVGLVWKGFARHENDRNRSLPRLDLLAPLWSVPGISFVSLQKGQGEDEARQSPPDRPLIVLGGEIEDFADTAAIVAQLDLVICVDTAVAHVAGALGKPCWVMLPAFDTDWRWLRERTDSPWYPGVMRLFRQAESGEWTEVIARVVEALEEWMSCRVV